MPKKLDLDTLLESLAKGTGITKEEATEKLCVAACQNFIKHPDGSNGKGLLTILIKYINTVDKEFFND